MRIKNPLRFAMCGLGYFERWTIVSVSCNEVRECGAGVDGVQGVPRSTSHVAGILGRAGVVRWTDVAQDCGVRA